jgi:hypothetical protein
MRLRIGTGFGVVVAQFSRNGRLFRNAKTASECVLTSNGPSLLIEKWAIAAASGFRFSMGRHHPYSDLVIQAGK